MMTLHDSLAQGKADSRSRIFVPGVEALKDLKYSFKIFRCDSDAVVPDGNDVISSFLLHGYMHAGLDAGLTVLHSIADQVLEQLHELNLVACDYRQNLPADFRLVFLN
jgi:hypothetical protein